jgi:diacylglycerol kinase
LATGDVRHYNVFMGMHRISKSFGYAFSGLHTAIREEPNFRIHLIFAIFAMIFGILLGLTSIEWIVLIFTIFFVIVLELLNTVLEAMVDLVSPDLKPAAKIAKDVSAACVLTAAFMSILVGFLLFAPKILALFP